MLSPEMERYLAATSESLLLGETRIGFEWHLPESNMSVYYVGDGEALLDARRWGDKKTEEGAMRSRGGGRDRRKD
jgi:hypothetical protein